MKLHEGNSDQQSNNNVTETRADINLCLKRRPTIENNFTVRYELNYTILKAKNHDNEGLYVCAMNKEDYSMHASVIVRRYSGEASKPPRVRLIPCQTGMRNNTLLIEKGKETCIRCQGYGDPSSEVKLMKAGDVVKPSRDILVRKHRNVESGGLAEAVYTFLNPNNNLADQYDCVVSVTKDGKTLSSSASFKIAITPGKK